jgi:hypothetical protein
MRRRMMDTLRTEVEAYIKANYAADRVERLLFLLDQEADL